MLIVLEGLDGAGKSTQIKMLKSYIFSKNMKIKYLHFPRYDAPVWGELIAKFLSGDFGTIDQVHPQLVALLYALDRADAGGVIRAWMQADFCVLLDRYVYSNIAYQCSKLKKEDEKLALREWILKLEYEHYKIPRPDINIFLDVPINFVDAKLKADRNGGDRDYLHGKQDIHEENIDFQKGVREIYLKETGEDKDFTRVDCSGDDGLMLPSDAIFEKIKKVLKF
ncbi:MAG: dTMP kinase [Bacteroidales bacterium]|nr:dTMP kinase [Bacteroidales bacterium]MDD2241630.1 dTMP kinase [Bacteroidales bacterium]MDD4419978.1 dTMP kinase [Bacteroidales bacterium]